MIGPYALQDFTLFQVLRYGFRPSKIAFLAWHAWRDVDEHEWADGLLRHGSSVLRHGALGPGRWLQVLDTYAGPTWTVDTVSLVESHLGQGPGGRPRYVEHGSFPFA